jgi:hypothetical protein
MKKIVVLVAFSIISSNMSADENSRELKNIKFTWQLFGYKTEEATIDFINLNPLLFDGHNYFSLGIFETNIQNNFPGNVESKNVYSQEGTNWFGILLPLSTIPMFWIDAYANPHANEYRNDIWEKKLEEDKLFHRIIRNYNTNY